MVTEESVRERIASILTDEGYRLFDWKGINEVSWVASEQGLPGGVRVDLEANYTPVSGALYIVCVTPTEVSTYILPLARAPWRPHRAPRYYTSVRQLLEILPQLTAQPQGCWG